MSIHALNINDSLLSRRKKRARAKRKPIASIHSFIHSFGSNLRQDKSLETTDAHADQRANESPEFRSPSQLDAFEGSGSRAS